MTAYTAVRRSGSLDAGEFALATPSLHALKAGTEKLGPPSEATCAHLDWCRQGPNRLMQSAHAHAMRVTNMLAQQTHTYARNTCGC